MGQQGTLTFSDTWFRLYILGLACAQIVETRLLELAMSLLDFSPRIPLGTFSILLLLQVALKHDLGFENRPTFTCSSVTLKW